MSWATCFANSEGRSWLARGRWAKASSSPLLLGDRPAGCPGLIRTRKKFSCAAGLPCSCTKPASAIPNWRKPWPPRSSATPGSPSPNFASRYFGRVFSIASSGGTRRIPGDSANLRRNFASREDLFAGSGFRKTLARAALVFCPIGGTTCRGSQLVFRGNVQGAWRYSNGFGHSAVFGSHPFSSSSAVFWIRSGKTRAQRRRGDFLVPGLPRG